LFERLYIASRIEWRAAQLDSMHPGRTAAILLDGEVIGFAGQVHPSVQKELDLKNTYVFEVKASALFNTVLPELKYTPIAKFPSITSDFALVVEKGVTVGTLTNIVKDAGGRLLKSVHVFGLYEGDKLE